MKNYCFEPRRVLFEPKALEYELGKSLWDQCKREGKEMRIIGSHNRVTGLPGKTPAEKYGEAKKTLVVGVRKGLKFASCRPSADYQLVLSTSCPGMCEYCYLQTTLGKQPVVRLYVNIDEILTAAQDVIDATKPKMTVFEGAATSDPLPVERYSGALARAIQFFAQQEFGRFRFVTKFTCVEPLLGLEHGGKTEFRFSVNTSEAIKLFEHGTPPLNARLQTAALVSAAGYPLGFLVAPIFLSPGWQEEYTTLFREMASILPTTISPTFELISHRFTARAKTNIASVFPASSLPMEEADRRYKYGQFGYGKYVYPLEDMKAATSYFTTLVEQYFPTGKVLYFV